MILLLVLLLILAGCATPTDEDAISTSVAAPLVSMDEAETEEPDVLMPPTVTPEVVGDPTLPPPTETPTPGPVTDEEAIKAAMNEHLDSPVDESTIIVSEIAGDLALFKNGQESVAKSHPEEGRYLYRFHPCNEILMRLYEIFETGKKQDLTPLRQLR